jgi:hypothetical protein
LDISPLFFHIVSTFVQALVITYDEIFQALTIKGDVLLTKTFLDLGFDGVSDGNRRPRRCSANRQKIYEAGDFLVHLTTPSKPRSRIGFGSRTSPFTIRAWKN